MPEYMTYERLKELEFLFQDNKKLSWAYPVCPLMADGTFGEEEKLVDKRWYIYSSAKDRYLSNGSVDVQQYDANKRSTEKEKRVFFNRDYFRNALNGTLVARPEWFKMAEYNISKKGASRRSLYDQNFVFLGDGSIVPIQRAEALQVQSNRMYLFFDDTKKKYRNLLFFEDKPYNSYKYTQWELSYYSDISESELLAIYHPPALPIFVKDKRIGGLWVKQGQQLVKPSGVYLKQNGAIKKL